MGGGEGELGGSLGEHLLDASCSMSTTCLTTCYYVLALQHGGVWRYHGLQLAMEEEAGRGGGDHQIRLGDHSILFIMTLG